MSKHGVRELKGIGLDPLYVPLGVDTETFKPDKEARAKYRKNFGWKDDDFIIGSVGLNYKDDRKGFIELLIAFNEFRKKHSDVRLYLHTHAEGIRDNSLNYANIMNHVAEDLDRYVMFGPQEAIDMNTIDRKSLNNLYNTFDVMCLPTKGEGFGMPVIESASAGVPVITTDTTTGLEFHAAGMVPWLIEVDEIDNREWMPTGTWRLRPRPLAVLDTLEKAYNTWKFGEWQGLKSSAREGALAYDWDLVWQKYWRAVLNILQYQKSDSKESPYV
jgi:glycosyltransferase involved in cell wall biosynthesis